MNHAKLYVSPVFNIPPSEKKASVLHVEIQEGCPHNTCSYCKTYRGESYRNKPLDEILENLEPTIQALSYHFRNSTAGSALDSITRIYLGGADILLHPELSDIISHLKDRLGKEVRVDLKIQKISGYASTMSLLKIREDVLAGLQMQGLNVLYWGLDSGSDFVLELCGKNYRKGEAMEAASRLNSSKIMASINVMPGLGGILGDDSHVSGTIDVLARANPRWVTLLTVDQEGTPYEQAISGNHANRPLTPKEITRQMLEITLGLEKRLKDQATMCEIAAHNQDKTPISKNPFTFNYPIGSSSSELARVVRRSHIRGLELKPSVKAAMGWQYFGLGLGKGIEYSFYGAMAIALSPVLLPVFGYLALSGKLSEKKQAPQGEQVTSN